MANDEARHPPIHRLRGLTVSREESIDGPTAYFIHFSYSEPERDGPRVDPIIPITCSVNRRTLEELKKRLEGVLGTPQITMGGPIA